MSYKKLIFRTDGSTKTGFGHLSRCLKIAKGLTSRENNYKITFCGYFSSDAAKIIKKYKLGLEIITEPNTKYDLGIIDTMFDSNNIEFYDLKEITKIKKICGKVLLICSSKNIPEKLDVDIVIAYLATKNPAVSYKILNSLSYAPVSNSFLKYRCDEKLINHKIKKIFIGLGGWHDLRPHKKAMNAIINSPISANIELLISPLLKQKIDSLKILSSKNNVSVHCGVSDLGKIINTADVAIVTYGNLMFELLALGVPTLVLGLKDFQASYADVLDREGVIISMGNEKDLTEKKMVDFINRMTRNKRKKLSKKSMSMIDTKGISRIVKVIENEF